MALCAVSIFFFPCLEARAEQTELRVVQNGKWGAVDMNGNTLVPFEYDEIQELMRGLGLFKVVKRLDAYDSLNGVVDSTGKTILPCQYSAIQVFHHKNADNSGSTERLRIAERLDGNTVLYGVADKNGREILPVQYGFVRDEAFGRYALYSPDGKAGLADDDGKVIIPLRYRSVSSSPNPDYIFVYDGVKCGLATPRHQILIKPDKFELIRYVFRHGQKFFFARAQGKWGRIDEKGAILLPLQYEEIEPSWENDNTFVARDDRQWMRIDDKGKVITAYEEYPYPQPPIVMTPPHL